MTTTRRTTRTLGLITTATAAISLALPVQAGSAAPRPLPVSSASAPIGHVTSPTDCAKKVRRLTERYMKAGMTGHAAHVAAELTLGC